MAASFRLVKYYNLPRSFEQCSESLYHEIRLGLEWDSPFLDYFIRIPNILVSIIPQLIINQHWFWTRLKFWVHSFMYRKSMEFILKNEKSLWQPFFIHSFNKPCIRKSRKLRVFEDWDFSSTLPLKTPACIWTAFSSFAPLSPRGIFMVHGFS